MFAAAFPRCHCRIKYPGWDGETGKKSVVYWRAVVNAIFVFFPSSLGTFYRRAIVCTQMTPASWPPTNPHRAHTRCRSSLYRSETTASTSVRWVTRPRQQTSAHAPRNLMSKHREKKENLCRMNNKILCVFNEEKFIWLRLPHFLRRRRLNLAE